MSEGTKKKLTEVAGVIRSKNAGPYELTFDIIFHDHETFQAVVRGGTITKQLFAGLYRMPESQVVAVVPYPPAKSIKITVVRPRPSGNLGETDVYGAQQHGPLLDLEVLLA